MQYNNGQSNHNMSAVVAPAATANKPTRPETLEGAQKRASPQILHYAIPFPALQTALPSSLVSYIAGLVFTSHINLQPRALQAVYDVFSQAVWVKDARSVEMLWAQGFFGKGSLSRSEPTWWTRAQNKMGAGLALTSEEVTALRRAERKEAKILKAKEKEEALLSNTPIPLESPVQTVVKKPKPVYKPRSAGLPWDHPDNQEHMQLQPEEAFYLIFALGSLDLTLPKSSVPLSIQQAYTLFVQPSLSFASIIPCTPTTPIRPDNPFLISYLIYHHYRSLGWVVRSGVKFCTDWVLYKGSNGSTGRGAGPPGGHAEFSVLIMKEYEDDEDRKSAIEEETFGALSQEEREELRSFGNEQETLGQEGDARRTWKWLSTINRVTSGVKKTLILAFVTIPSSKSITQQELHSPHCLQRYDVREVSIRRFVPARLRD